MNQISRSLPSCLLHSRLIESDSNEFLHCLPVRVILILRAHQHILSAVCLCVCFAILNNSEQLMNHLEVRKPLCRKIQKYLLF